MPPTGGRGPHEAVQIGFDNRPESHLAAAIHPRQTFRDSLLALISGSARRPRLLVIPTLIEVAERFAPKQREPAPTLMLRPVVQHVTALAERLQVRGPVVGWVVIEMRAGQNHAGRSDSPLPQPQRG